MAHRVLLVLVFVLGCFSIAGGAVAKQQVNLRGVWMAGPGCGARFEWFQHPAWFPYFCDGNAEVEKAHWSNWGAQKATASAILNEAELKSGSSVATAPRTRRAVTIKASQIKVCGGRHAYTRIIIRFHKATNGIKKLRYASLLPKCSSPGQAQNRHLTNGFLSPDKKVFCLFDLGSGFCGVGAPKSRTMGELAAWISKAGKVDICSVSEPSLEETCFQNFDETAPVLRYGDWTRAEGIRCRSARNGIICIEVSGAGKGHGFRVNKDEAVEIEA